jgi:hypothetical protein
MANHNCRGSYSISKSCACPRLRGTALPARGRPVWRSTPLSSQGCRRPAKSRRARTVGGLGICSHLCKHGQLYTQNDSQRHCRQPEGSRGSAEGPTGNFRGGRGEDGNESNSGTAASHQSQAIALKNAGESLDRIRRHGGAQRRRLHEAFSRCGGRSGRRGWTTYPRKNPPLPLDRKRIWRGTNANDRSLTPAGPLDGATCPPQLPQ